MPWLCSRRDSASQYDGSNTLSRYVVAHSVIPGGDTDPSRLCKSSSGVFDNQTWAQVMPWINLLIGYDVILLRLLSWFLMKWYRSNSMQSKPRLLFILDILSGVLILLTMLMIFFYAPVEAIMGAVQKVFYFHVSSPG